MEMAERVGHVLDGVHLQISVRLVKQEVLGRTSRSLNEKIDRYRREIIERVKLYLERLVTLQVELVQLRVDGSSVDDDASGQVLVHVRAHARGRSGREHLT